MLCANAPATKVLVDYFEGREAALVNKLLVELQAKGQKEAQTIISTDYVNGYLFQLAATSVAKTGVQGMWLNAPTQAIDLTGISWAD